MEIILQCMCMELMSNLYHALMICLCEYLNLHSEFLSIAMFSNSFSHMHCCVLQDFSLHRFAWLVMQN